ncbi:helix-turn-helix domain-containing protein [Parafrankia sp. FMc2]|uniref:helix-turn-helix domain-containing protein n=1 Tax=Parafrankia sp. FMc2 TaxID=3233196 RepID=UPI0034D6DB1E
MTGQRYTEADLTGPDTPLTLPLVPNVAGILGVGENEAYRRAKDGTLPVPAWKIGNRWMVPTARLRELLGLTPPPQAERPALDVAVLDAVLGEAMVILPMSALRRALGLGQQEETGPTQEEESGPAPGPVILRNTA